MKNIFKNYTKSILTTTSVFALMLNLTGDVSASSEAMEVDEADAIGAHLSLMDLPTEVLCHIAGQDTAIYYPLKQTCTKFNDIVDGDWLIDAFIDGVTRTFTAMASGVYEEETCLQEDLSRILSSHFADAAAIRAYKENFLKSKTPDDADLDFGSHLIEKFQNIIDVTKEIVEADVSTTGQMVLCKRGLLILPSSLKRLKNLGLLSFLENQITEISPSIFEGLDRLSLLSINTELLPKFLQKTDESSLLSFGHIKAWISYEVKQKALLEAPTVEVDEGEAATASK